MDFFITGYFPPTGIVFRWYLPLLTFVSGCPVLGARLSSSYALMVHTGAGRPLHGSSLLPSDSDLMMRSRDSSGHSELRATSPRHDGGSPSWKIGPDGFYGSGWGETIDWDALNAPSGTARRRHERPEIRGS